MTIHRILPFALAAVMPALGMAANGSLTVKAVNKLQLARPCQTLELQAKDIESLGAKTLDTLHVRDAAGNEVLCQAVDNDFDAYHKQDAVIFQADFAPGETRTFTVSVGAKQSYTKEQFKAHGRFVRERFDDFAWENDRIAHRTYGKALETWAGEPLTSSTIDIWSKRVPRMIVDEWYMTDNYHADTGTGADFYSAGKSRGCGGNGLWAGDKLWVSANFVNSRVLANGPIRVVFELVYDAFDVNGTKVSEVKRVTLDAGSNLDHFQSFYKTEKPGELVSGVGLKKVDGAEKVFNAAQGWMAVWEKMAKGQGMQGLAVVVDPKSLEKETTDSLNHLVLVKTTPDNRVSYWAGFFWEKTGQFSGFDAWKKYLDEFSQGLASPIEVTVSAQ